MTQLFGSVLEYAECVIAKTCKITQCSSIVVYRISSVVVLTNYIVMKYSCLQQNISYRNA